MLFNWEDDFIERDDTTGAEARFNSFFRPINGLENAILSNSFVGSMFFLAPRVLCITKRTRDILTFVREPMFEEVEFHDSYAIDLPERA